MKVFSSFVCCLALFAVFSGCGGGGFKYEDPATRDGVSIEEQDPAGDAGVVTDPAMMGDPNQ